MPTLCDTEIKLTDVLKNASAYKRKGYDIKVYNIY